MQRLSASTTPTDQTRATRAVLAWLAGDKFALDVVLAQVMKDPTGTPGLLFALIDFTARLGNQVAPDFADQLRLSLLAPNEDDGR